MTIEFYHKGKVIDSWDSNSSIPRIGEKVLLNESITYTVKDIVWVNPTWVDIEVDDWEIV